MIMCNYLLTRLEDNFMLAITPQHRFFIAIEPVDFRNGIDGLKAICCKKFQADPFSGAFFIFRNRCGTSIKLLAYDGNGFWLCQKRFSKGKCSWWPRAAEQAHSLRAIELLLMLQQGDPTASDLPLDWRQLSASSVDNSRATTAKAFLKQLLDVPVVPSNNVVDFPLPNDTYK